MTLPLAKRVKPSRRIKLGPDPFVIQGSILGRDGLFIGELHGGVIKLERQSLDRAWLCPGEDMAPVAVQGEVLLIAGRGGLRGVDQRTGSSLWGPRSVGPCVEWSQGLLALQPLAVLNPKQGTVERTFNVSEELVGNPFVAGNKLVATSLRGDPITALELIGQKVIWKRNLFAEITQRTGRSEPAFMVWPGDDTFLVSRTDLIAGCSLADGTIRWEAAVGVPYYVPNTSGGRAYVLIAGQTPAASLVCVETRNGTKVYDIPQPELQIGERPFRGTLAADEIVFCTTRGLVIAFRLEDGTTSWWHRSRDRLAPPIAADGRVLVPTLSGDLLVFEPTHGQREREQRL
jgi:hypothetical protein